MTILEAVVVVLAGTAAGILNTVVGSGTLLTFPVLVGLGVPPVQANVANNIGLAPGSISGAIGYRGELREPTRKVIQYCIAAAAGGIVGALLLVTLPENVFRTVVPYLIALAVVLVAAQPWISKKLQGSSTIGTYGDGWLLTTGTFLTSVYGGYFGAGQGVILLAVMGVLMATHIQRINALKNVLQAVDNGLSALVFAVISDVRWVLVLLLALGAIAGGQIGARLGRSIPESWFRVIIVIVGLLGIVQFIS